MKNFKLHTLFSLLAIFAVMIPGCGGGSRGTGTLTIEGRVLNTRGQAVQSADVTNLETGATTKTTSNGSFELVTESLSGELSFLIDTGAFEVTSRGGGQISEDVERIKVNITLNTTSAKPTAEQNITITNRKPNNSSSSSSSNSSSSSSSSKSSSSSNSSSSSQSSDDDGDDDNSTSSSSSSSSSDDDNDDQTEVRVQGNIQNITANTITVKQTTFTVNNETEFDGYERLSDFSVGEEVEIKGRFISEVLVAEEIKLED